MGLSGQTASWTPVCYAEGTGDGSDTSWRDSYIRLSISKISSITSAGVTHTDHGTIGDHSSLTAPLLLEYAGTLPVAKYLSLVNEALNNNDPCASGNVAGAAAGTDRSGPLTAAAGTRIAPGTSSALSTTLQFAVCYTEKDHAQFTGSTWYDSGIRLMKSSIDTLRYNEEQLPPSTSGPTARWTTRAPSRPRTRTGGAAT